MPYLLLLCLWIAAHLIQMGFGTVAAWRLGRGQSGWNALAVVVSAMASVFPLLTCVVFCLLVFSGGSSTAQMNGEGTMSLWSLWVQTWPVFVFFDPPSFALAALAVVIMPLPSRGVPSLVSRLSGVVASGLACWMIFKFFPDA